MALAQLRRDAASSDGVNVKKALFLHIGPHKTGTTSIQRFLQENRARLHELGIDFYQGRYLLQNHDEISGACLRADRASGFKIRHNFKSEEMFGTVAASVREFIARSSCPKVLFSSEGISYLRFPDEMARLHALLPADCPKRFAFYVRNQDDWIRSFKAEVAWTGETRDQEAWNYTEPDTWLLRFDERIGGFCKAFGNDNITVINYDRCVAAEGSVIPALLQWLDVRVHFDPTSWADIWEHARPR